MSSGVNVSSQCIQTFQALKSQRAHKYIIFNLNQDMTEIVVEKASSDPSYDAFLNDLPASECRWAVYDFEFETDGKRSKLCFFSWTPDEARIKPKMVFASSRETLKRKLEGIAVDIQGTDYDEVGHKTVLNKATKSTTR